MEDKKIVCKECGNEFDFTAKEQEFYQQRGLFEPKRCKECRDKFKKNKEDNKKFYGNKKN